MECPKCGAENPDYAVYCGSCAALIKKPRFRSEWRRKERRLVIETRWARLGRMIKTAITLLFIAACLVLLIRLHPYGKGIF